jgi:hypothetical protein
VITLQHYHSSQTMSGAWVSWTRVHISVFASLSLCLQLVGRLPPGLIPIHCDMSVEPAVATRSGHQTLQLQTWLSEFSVRVCEHTARPESTHICAVCVINIINTLTYHRGDTRGSGWLLIVFHTHIIATHGNVEHYTRSQPVWIIHTAHQGG